MIVSQGYWLELECSDQCGREEIITGETKEECKRKARQAGWSLSKSSHSCWCSECKPYHTASYKMGKR